MSETRDLTFCPLEKEHLESILVLEKEAFAVPWTRGMFEEELKNPLARYYVLLADGEVAGYAGMWVILGEGHITNIAVSKNHRRQGWGRMLLEYLLEQGKKLGVEAFTLEVRKGNQAAVALYASSGFKAAGLRKNYYSDNGEDAVIMWRNHG